MRNIIKTTTPPVIYEPHLQSQYCEWGGGNIWIDEVTDVTNEGSGYYLYDVYAEYGTYAPEYLKGKYEMSHNTRRIRLSASSGVYTVTAVTHTASSTMYFVGNFGGSHGAERLCLYEYSGTTSESTVATPITYGSYNAVIRRCNSLVNHNWIDEPIPGVAYNPSSDFVFYNPEFPLLNLSSTPETEEKRQYVEQYGQSSAVNHYTFDELGIDRDVLDRYLETVENNDVALRDFNIFVDGNPVIGIENLVNCSCWAGLWFSFSENYDLWVVFEGGDDLWVTTSM